MVLVWSLVAASWLLIVWLVRLFVKTFFEAEGDGLGARRLARPGRSVMRIPRPPAGVSRQGTAAARSGSSHHKPDCTDAALDRLALHARRVLDAERVCLLTLDSRESTQTAPVIVAQVGWGTDLVARNSRLDAGLAALALSCGHLAVSPPQAGLSAPPSRCDGRGWEAAAPLSDSLAPPRVLVAGWAESHPAPRRAELELLCEFASLASRAVERQHHANAAASEPPPDIHTLAETLAARAGPTWQHSVEVAELATRVAKCLRLGPHDQREVRLAALLHDVGKLRLPTELLRRPGPLTRAEWDLMSRHSEWGADTIAAVPGLEAVAMIVRLHHERPDGRGYPHRLASSRIPTASRIVSVCDAYCAMTSGRAYQPSRSPQDAMQELKRHAGTQFDDQIVAALGEVVPYLTPLAA